MLCQQKMRERERRARSLLLITVNERSVLTHATIDYVPRGEEGTWLRKTSRKGLEATADLTLPRSKQTSVHS